MTGGSGLAEEGGDGRTLGDEAAGELAEGGGGTHTTTLWGVPEHDVCARLCVCGTDVVVLCAGLPAGTEDVTAAAAAAAAAGMGWRALALTQVHQLLL